jgi:dTDP-4-dehydrorhamnose reductase
MRVLVLGATGMLGSAVHRVFSEDSGHEVWGTLRSAEGRRFFTESDNRRLLTGVDMLDHDGLVSLVRRVHPELVINCVGLIKQLATANDPLAVLPINAMLPHRLARLCDLVGARLIHVSTDCVFSGRTGHYRESDRSDAEDLYGQSKFLGELPQGSTAVTLRTSIIGHELQSRNALVDWFLSQPGPVKGYTKAVFSGVPSVELARVMRDYVGPRPELKGIYHVSAKPIAKFDLLTLVARVYGKEATIVPDHSVVVDRSLNSDRFSAATGYVAAEWPDLIALMHRYRKVNV